MAEFHEDPNIDEKEAGYQAGWRGDELLDGHSEIYLEYYELGQAAKQNETERRKQSVRDLAAGNGQVDLRRHRSHDLGE